MPIWGPDPTPIDNIALEVGDIEEALSFYGRIFEFKLRGKSENMAFIALVTSSSRYKRDGASHLMVGATSVLLSMTRMSRAKRWPRPVCNHCLDRSSTSATLGAIASRLLVTTMFSSLRRGTCCGAWD